MRISLKKLMDSSVVLRYQLPCYITDKHVPRCHISTRNDRFLEQIGSNDNIANLIYNGIVEYAYNDNEINTTQLDKLQIRALQSKLKYNPNASDETMLGYGFQGEVLLHLILDYYFGARKAIARGYMFSALENAETKGYDSYLMIENHNAISLLFGEAKFYLSGYKYSLKSIFKNIDNALSDNYLNRNFIAMDNHYEHLDENSRIKQIIDNWRDNPLINMAEEAKKQNIQLVYPMLVVFDDKKDTYENLILEILAYIRTSYNAVHSTLTIPCDIFFIFFSVDNSRTIKTQVLQWIKQQQPLMP